MSLLLYIRLSLLQASALPISVSRIQKFLNITEITKSSGSWLDSLSVLQHGLTYYKTAFPKLFSFQLSRYWLSALQTVFCFLFWGGYHSCPQTQIFSGMVAKHMKESHKSPEFLQWTMQIVPYGGFALVTSQDPTQSLIHSTAPGKKIEWVSSWIIYWLLLWTKQTWLGKINLIYC